MWVWIGVWWYKLYYPIMPSLSSFTSSARIKMENEFAQHMIIFSVNITVGSTLLKRRLILSYYWNNLAYF
jgi:hypothetical protein